MDRSSVARRVLPAVFLAAAACTSPSEPDPFAEPPEGTHQSALVAVVGTGTGGTSVTPSSTPEGTFLATIRFRVRAKPNTTYVVQRAAEVGRPNGADGICQRAQGAPPWSSADAPFGPSFLSFPLPGAGPIRTLATDASGEAAVDFEFRSPALHAGDQFDVQMRLIDREEAPTSELRSGCMTVVVR